jgi:hypothetical protein
MVLAGYLTWRSRAPAPIPPAPPPVDDDDTEQADPQENAAEVEQDPHVRLLLFLEAPERHRILIRRPNASRQWARVTGFVAGNLELSDRGPDVPVRAVREFIVSAPNGEVVDVHPRHVRPPATASAIERAHEVDQVPTIDQIDAGSAFVRVAFTRSPNHPNDPGYYATLITNLTNEDVTVLWFAAFVRDGDTLRLSPAADGVFTDEQFRLWYGVRADGWIGPEESVTDPHSQGSPALWAYRMQTRSGRTFVTGAWAPDAEA